MDTAFFKQKLGDTFKQINDSNIMGTYRYFNVTVTELRGFASSSVYINGDNETAQRLTEQIKAGYSDIVCNYNGGAVNFLINYESSSQEKIFDIFDDIIDFCNVNGIITIPVDDNFYKKKNKTVVHNQVNIRKENLLLGFIGALFGAVPGIILWLVIGYFGYIASICGFVIGIGILYGYKLLAGGISRNGAIICLLMLLCATASAVVLNYVVYFVISDGMTFTDSLYWVLSALKNYPEITREFSKDVAISLAFSLLGSGKLLINILR